MSPEVSVRVRHIESGILVQVVLGFLIQGYVWMLAYYLDFLSRVRVGNHICVNNGHSFLGNSALFFLSFKSVLLLLGS